MDCYNIVPALFDTPARLREWLSHHYYERYNIRIPSRCVLTAIARDLTGDSDLYVANHGPDGLALRSRSSPLVAPLPRWAADLLSALESPRPYEPVTGRDVITVLDRMLPTGDAS